MLKHGITDLRIFFDNETSENRTVLEGVRMARRLHEDSRRHARHLRAAMSVPVLEIPRQVGVRPGLATTEAVADVLIEGAA